MGPFLLQMDCIRVPRTILYIFIPYFRARVCDPKIRLFCEIEQAARFRTP